MSGQKVELESNEDSPPKDYNLIRLADANTAVGTAVRLMFTQPAFAKLTFGEWVAVVDGQVARGHYGFVVDETGKVLGFIGWALATPEKAEGWAAGAPLASEECRAGECLIVNAWVEAEPAVHRFMVGALRALVVGKTTIFSRRVGADGTMRVVRLPVDQFVSGRAALAATMPAAS